MLRCIYYLAKLSGDHGQWVYHHAWHIRMNNKAELTSDTV